MKDKIETINNMIDYFKNRLSQGFDRYGELIYEDAVDVLQNIKVAMKIQKNSLYGYQATENLKTNGFTGGFTQQFTLNIYSNVDIIVMNKTGDKMYKNVDVFEHFDYLKISMQDDEFIIFNKDKIEWFQIRKHIEDINNCRKIIKEDNLGFITESEVEK